MLGARPASMEDLISAAPGCQFGEFVEEHDLGVRAQTFAPQAGVQGVSLARGRV